MPPSTPPWQHNHDFAQVHHQAEKNTHRVIILTLVMMVLEILVGWLSGSMALLADGWHMGTHVFALGITALAYAYSRQHAQDPSYSYGTGKVGILSGYTSALLLAAVAGIMVIESLQRLIAPDTIHFDEALWVAVIGLIVNLVSARMLHDGSQGHHHHAESHHHHHHDHNLKAAYLHVVADALTSVLAIVALLCGKYFGWTWLDPSMGLVGAVVIGIWSWGLLKETSTILLDRHTNSDLRQQLTDLLEDDTTQVVDVHLRWLTTNTMAAEITVVAEQPLAPQVYRQRLAPIKRLDHVTIEVHRLTVS